MNKLASGASAGGGTSANSPAWCLPITPCGELRLLSQFQPGRDERLVPVVRERPLRDFSDYVCSILPARYDAVLAGSMTAEELFDELESLARTLDADAVERLIADPKSTAARVACLDIAFAERFLCVAHGGPTQEYRARRAKAVWFNVGVRLARSQERSPFLQWTDIAVGHPVWDPRTFSSPGRGRDQEILLYRIQSGIERAFRQIVVEWPRTHMTEKDARSIGELLDAVVAGMIHMSRVRDIGEFDKLNRFLTPNGETHGHATGSFSVWTMLASYLLTGHLLDRLVDPENRPAFDPDSRPWIDAIVAGEMTPLNSLRGEHPDVDELVDYVIRQYRRFHEVHRGAVRKHASAAHAQQAPSNRLITNKESFEEVIAITDVGRKALRDNTIPSEGRGRVLVA